MSVVLSTDKTETPRYNLNIVESGVKRHNHNHYSRTYIVYYWINNFWNEKYNVS